MNMQTLLLKKKKKTYPILLDDFVHADIEDIKSTLPEIENRLKNIMKFHIGKENSISHSELWSEVLGLPIDYLDIYQRQYWWNIIREILRKLRGEEILFTINLSSQIFVLKSGEELNSYLHKIDSIRESLNTTKLKARKWVNSKSWEKI